MAIVEDVADSLAKKAIKIAMETGDENVEKRIADEIGASSPTLQEAFLTAVRIRKAELRAIGLLKKYARGEVVEKAAISSQPQDDGGH